MCFYVRIYMDYTSLLFIRKTYCNKDGQKATYEREWEGSHFRNEQQRRPFIDFKASKRIEAGLNVLSTDDIFQIQVFFGYFFT